MVLIFVVEGIRRWRESQAIAKQQQNKKKSYWRRNIGERGKRNLWIRFFPSSSSFLCLFVFSCIYRAVDVVSFNKKKNSRTICIFSFCWEIKYEKKIREKKRNRMKFSSLYNKTKIWILFYIRSFVLIFSKIYIYMLELNMMF